MKQIYIEHYVYAKVNIKYTGLLHDVYLLCFFSDIYNVVFSFISQGQVLQCCRQTIPAQ